MNDPRASAGGEPRHGRLSVAAKRPYAQSLRVRLLVLVAVIVAGVIGAVAYLEMGSFRRQIERELDDTARQTATAVANDLRSRPSFPDAADMQDTLNDFAKADPVLRSISIVAIDRAGAAEVIASTSSEERAGVVSLASRALAAAGVVTEGGAGFLSAAAPLSSPTLSAAVVATVSTAGVEHERQHGRSIALEFALPAILLVVGLLEITTRRLVHQPLAAIRRTMNAAGGGDMAARAPVLRNDEIGQIADGLNVMLDRVEHFNDTLQARVREATAELELRNDELERSYDERLALREALARTERMAAVGQMAATVAHQLGTPLNLVSGYVQMIREDPRADDRIRQRLATVELQIRQVTRVLRTMLDQARQPSVLEKTNLAQIVERTCELARPRLARAGVTIDVSMPDALLAVDVDRVQFELALLNLIVNAVDAMPEGGTVTIRAAVGPDGVRLEIADTGAGIPASVIDRVFEPWVTTKPVGQGTGLGLSIVRDVVQTHGGRVSARNGTSGGAVFVIELPLAASASPV